jgi:hypothetical protein
MRQNGRGFLLLKMLMFLFLDSELQFLVLYCVLLIPNYSFLVLYCVLLIPNYSFLVLYCILLIPNYSFLVLNCESGFLTTVLVLICGTAAPGPELLTRVLSCGL